MTQTAVLTTSDGSHDDSPAAQAVLSTETVPDAPAVLPNDVSREPTKATTDAAPAADKKLTHATSVVDVEHVAVEDDPRLWSALKKNIVLLVVSAAAFIAAMASSIFFPAVPQVQADLHASSSQIALTASMFILFQGIFPTFWAATSEIVGRKPCYLVSSVIFIAASIGCALAPSIEALIALRVVQSMGASAVLSLGAGSLADLFDTHERGEKMGIFYGAPLLAQSAAPLVGGGLTSASTWRSVFWFCVAYAGVCLIAQLWLPEPFRKERSLAWRKAAKRAEAAALQKAARKADRATIDSTDSTAADASETTGSPKEAKATPDATPAPATLADLPPVRGGPSRVSVKGNTLVLEDGSTAEVKVSLADVNPFATVGAIVRKPNNLFLSVFTGLLFGNSYCLLYTGGITFAQAPYSYSPLIVGCVLLAFGAGNIAGSILGGRYSDVVYAKLKAANDDKGEPEMRIRSTYPTLILLPLSLVGYAWAVNEGAHIAICCCLLFLTGMAGIWAYSSLLAYIVDANPGRASSAIAFNSACRGFAACIASQVSDPLLQRMGHSWFYTGFAGAMLLGELSLLVVERRGKAWREGTRQQGRRILSARQDVPDARAPPSGGEEAVAEKSSG